ncbi:PEP-CTERM sorting domain-containing protein [Salidesulfovibrio brasiliensis]|uniref:PEP-CTERM sorting domain-containing protein n=1 Tax=Salidesulfovibrio brasiliensis TaxID=221711 RepID=UPI0006D14551|nr:PEP-CTERM sorting domain-containing protein [Salidesulfovibrio brasiliensis]
MLQRVLWVVCAIVVVGFCNAPAQAATVYFGQDLSGGSVDDLDPYIAESGFQSHFPTVYMEDFESGSGIDFGNGVTATANNGRLSSAVSETHFGSGYWVTSSGSSITFSFSESVLGFGLWLGDLDYGADLFVALDQSDPFNVPDTVNSGGTDDEIAFLGVVSDANPFSAFTLSGLTAWVDYDNLQIGTTTAEPVPEPSTILLLLIGFGGTALVGLKRRSRDL